MPCVIEYNGRYFDNFNAFRKAYDINNELSYVGNTFKVLVKPPIVAYTVPIEVDVSIIGTNPTGLDGLYEIDNRQFRISVSPSQLGDRVDTTSKQIEQVKQTEQIEQVDENTTPPVFIPAPKKEEGDVKVKLNRLSSTTQEETQTWNQSTITAITSNPVKAWRNNIRKALEKLDTSLYRIKFIKDNFDLYLQDSSNVLSNSDLEGVVFIITDELGSPIYFDKDGNPTTKDNAYFIEQKNKDGVPVEKYIVPFSFDSESVIRRKETEIIQAIANANEINVQEARIILEHQIAVINNIRNRVLSGEEIITDITAINDGHYSKKKSTESIKPLLDQKSITNWRIEVGESRFSGRLFLTNNGNEFYVFRRLKNYKNYWDLVNAVKTVEEAKSVKDFLEKEIYTSNDGFVRFRQRGNKVEILTRVSPKDAFTVSDETSFKKAFVKSQGSVSIKGLESNQYELYSVKDGNVVKEIVNYKDYIWEDLESNILFTRDNEADTYKAVKYNGYISYQEPVLKDLENDVKKTIKIGSSTFTTESRLDSNSLINELNIALLNNIRGINIPVRFDTTQNIAAALGRNPVLSETYGYYDRNSKEIVLNIDTPEKYVSRFFAEEYIHALTVDYLANNPESELTKQLSDLRTKVKDFVNSNRDKLQPYFPKENVSAEQQTKNYNRRLNEIDYQLDSNEEFLAAIFLNPNLQKIMEGVKSDSVSLLDQFKEWIEKLLTLLYPSAKESFKEGLKVSFQIIKSGEITNDRVTQIKATQKKKLFGSPPNSTLDVEFTPVTQYSIVNTIDADLIEFVASSDNASFAKFIQGGYDIKGIFQAQYEILKLEYENNKDHTRYKFATYVLDNFDAVFNHWTANTKRFNVKVSSEEISIELENGENITIENAEDAIEQNVYDKYGKASYQTSPIHDAGKEIKTLLASIPKFDKDRNGKVSNRYTNYGGTELVNPYWLFNVVLDTTKGEYDIEKMLRKLEVASEVTPEIKVLLERLPKLDSELSEYDIKMLLSFYKAFSKAHVPLNTLLHLGDGSVSFYETTRSNRDAVVAKINQKFQDGLAGEYSRYALYHEETNSTYLNTELVLSDIKNKTLKFWELYKLLGFYITNAGTDASLRQSLDLDRTQEEIIKLLEQRKGIRLNESFTQLSRKAGSSQGLSGRLGKIVEHETKFNKTHVSFSTRNAEGQIVYSISQWNTFLLYSYYLNSVSNLSELEDNPETIRFTDKNPLFKRSLTRQKMFGNNGERIGNLNVINYAGMEYEGRDEGASTTSLSDRDWIRMNWFSLHTKGYKELMRIETASSAYAFNLSNWGNASFLPISPNQSVNEIISNTRDILTNYLKGEIERIILVRTNNVPKGIYQLDASNFVMFDSILSADLKKTFIAAIEANPGLNIDELVTINASAVQTDLNKFLRNEVESFRNERLARGLNLKELSSPTLADLNADTFAKYENVFVFNSLIFNFEQVAVFDGDLAFFKDYYKRAKGMHSTGTPLSSPSFMLNHFNKTHDNTFGSVFNKEPVNTNTVRTTVDLDDEIPSQQLPAILRSIRQSYEIANNKPITEEELNAYRVYENVNATDGQGYATMDFYRKIRVLANSWSADDEIGYRYMLADYRVTKDQYSIYDNPAQVKQSDQEFIKKYRKDINNGTIHFNFNVIKAQFRGPILTELNAQGIIPEGMDKFSILPLLPQAIEDTHLERVNEEMLSKNISYRKYKSGSKLSAWNMNALLDDNRNLADITISEESVNEVPLAFIKEQIVTSSKYKTVNIFGTQFRALLFQNHFSNGEILNPEIKEAYTSYSEAVGRLTEIAKKELFDKLHIKQEGDILHFEDFNFLLDALEEEAISRDLNKNVLDFIKDNREQLKSLDLKTVLPIPFEISPNKQTIENLLQGMINKKLVRQKISGSQLTLFSSSLFNNGISLTGTTGLPFYQLDKDGNTQSMGVITTLDGEFKKLLNIDYNGTRIGTVKRLNDLLNTVHTIQWNRNILAQDISVEEETIYQWYKTTLQPAITMTGYRIPTQGLNSMDVMEVYRFLPTGSGTVLGVPAELTGKAGIDFDNDKHNVIIPILDNSGRVIKPASKEDIQKDLDRLNTEVEEYVEDLFPESSIKLFKKEHSSLIAEFKEHKAKLQNLFDILNLVDTKRFKKALEGKTDEQKIELTNLREALYVDEADRQEIKRMYQTEVDSLLKVSAYYKNLLNLKVETKQGFYDLVEEKRNLELQLDEKSQLTNQIIESSKVAISHPSVYYQLVRPNTTIDLKTVVNEITDITGNKVQSYKGTNVLRIGSNISKFKSMLEPKDMLSVAAVNNKFNAVFQEIGLHLNQTYVKFDNEFNLNLHLLDKETQTKIDKEEQWDISSITLEDGMLKSEAFSQTINATVDAASDDFITSANINMNNIGALCYTIHLGVPLLKSLLLFNQPIIRHFEQQLQINADKDNPKSDTFKQIVESLYTIPELQEMYPTLFYTYDKGGLVKDKQGEPKLKKGYKWGELVEMLDNNGTAFSVDKMKSTLIGSDDKLEQLTYLAHYLKLQDQASLLREYETYNNFDTSPAKSLFDNKMKQDTKFNVVLSYFIPKDFINAIREKSVIKSMNIGEEFKQIFENVFPYISELSESFQVIDKITNFEGTRDKLMRTLSNDWIESIIKTYGKTTGKLSEVGLQFFKAFPTALRDIKTKHPELSTNPLVQRLQRIDAVGLANYKVQTSYDSTGDSENEIILAFEELLNHNDINVQRTFKALAILSFLQSGFNRSNISFFHLTPFNALKGMFIKALEEYNLASKENSVSKFLGQFNHNNPTLLSRKEKIALRNKVKYDRNGLVQFGNEFYTRNEVMKGDADKYLVDGNPYRHYYKVYDTLEKPIADLKQKQVKSIYSSYLFDTVIGDSSYNLPTAIHYTKLAEAFANEDWESLMLLKVLSLGNKPVNHVQIKTKEGVIFDKLKVYKEGLTAQLSQNIEMMDIAFDNPTLDKILKETQEEFKSCQI